MEWPAFQLLDWDRQLHAPVPIYGYRFDREIFSSSHIPHVPLVDGRVEQSNADVHLFRLGLENL
ncbi:hypothetical protein D3C76_28340 [compost metagenome]